MVRQQVRMNGMRLTRTYRHNITTSPQRTHITVTDLLVQNMFSRGILRGVFWNCYRNSGQSQTDTTRT